MECAVFLLFLFTLTALIVALVSYGRITSLQRELRKLRESLTVQPDRIEEPEPNPDAIPIQEPIPTPEPLPTPPPEPPPPQPPPKPPMIPAKPFDWEGLVGIKLFSWIAGIALALAAVFFLRYSIDHGWLTPGIRMVMGLFTGVALLIVCELKIANRYRITANAFDAAGIAILYATLFASNILWHLLPSFVTFLLMVVVTAGAVFLAIHRDSIFIALLGLVGGFATPALLSTGEDRPISLFGYLLLVNAGLAWLAFRKKWPVLMALSIAFTVFYQWAWVWKFLDERRLPLAASIFIAFPLLSVGAYLLSSRSADERSFERSAATSALLPILFAVYGAAVPAYGAQLHTLFAFVLCIDAGLAFLAARSPRLGALHALGGFGTLTVFVIWITVSYTSAAWPAILIWTAVFVLFYYLPVTHLPVILRSEATKDPHPTSHSAIVGSLLLFAFPALVILEKSTASPLVLFGTLLALSAVASWLDRRSIWYVAAFFVLATETAWTARYLDAEQLNSALLIYGAFALLFLLRNTAFLALTTYLFLLAIASERHLMTNPWPLLSLLIALVLAIGIVALIRRDARVHIGSMLLSQLVLTAWVFAARSFPSPTIGLLLSLGICAFASALSFKWTAPNTEGTAGVPPASRPQAGLATAAITSLFAGELVLIAAIAVRGTPPFVLLLTAQIALLAALLWIAATTNRHGIAILAIIPTAIASFVMLEQEIEWTGIWTEPFIFALAIYLMFLAYPFILGARVGSAIKPYLAAVLAGVPFFFLARQVMIEGGWESAIGILPVAQAALMLLLLMRLLQIEPPEQRAMGRLALVAGAALAFVTVAIPLQLEKEWITIGWGLQAAALAWLYTRIPHRGLFLWASALLAIVFVRLVFNEAVFSYHPRDGMPVLNWYLYTYLVTAAAFFVAAWFFRRTDDKIVKGFPRFSSLLIAAAGVLLFLVLNIEIADFYAQGPALTFNFFHASLAQDLTYTLGWALFAIAMLIAGISFRNRVTRVAAILLLVVTIFKCFLHDLGRLGGLYRVGSFVGLAICLALVALLLQRFVMTSQLKGEVVSGQ